MDVDNGNGKITMAVLGAQLQALTVTVQEIKVQLAALHACITKEEIASARATDSLAAVKKQLDDQDKKIAVLEELMEKYIPVAKVALYLAGALTIPAIIALLSFLWGIINHTIKIGP